MLIIIIISAGGHQPLDLGPIELMLSIEGIPGLPPPMQLRPHNPIPNHNPLQINGLFGRRHPILIDNLIRQEGNIHPTVTLTRHPEVIGLVFGVDLEPFDEGFVGGLGRTQFCVLVGGVLVLGEAHSGGVFEVEDVGELVPGVGVY